jgi:sterol desaturase/sphingolipid hydroxylase (fatty acid hydroxylase superfamily)
MVDKVKRLFEETDETPPVPPEIIPVILFGLIIQYYVKLKQEMKGMTDMELRLLVVKQVMGVVGGLYCADFFTGLVHITLDHFLDVPFSHDTFSVHHKRPKEILDASIYDLYCQLVLGFPIPVFIALCQQMNDSPSEQILGNIVFMTVAVSSQLIHRETHNYNHNKGDGTMRTRVYGILSDLGLVMSAEYHKAHHAAEKNDINFPIVNGWSSPLMNFLVRNTGILNHL